MMAIDFASNLPYILSLLGGSLASPGSQIQQMAGTINQMAQQQAYQQYVNRKQVDPGAKAPLGLSPELQMRADSMIQQMQQQKFQQEIANKTLALQEKQVSQAETLAEKEVQGKMSLLEKEGSLKMEQLKADNEERRKQAEQENKMRLDIIKEQMKAEREIQKMRLAAQKEIASSESSLRKEALEIERQGGIDTQAYRDKMLQLQSLETIGNMYNSGMSDEQIASYASGTLSKMGINLPTVTSLPSMKQTNALGDNRNYMGLIDIGSSNYSNIPAGTAKPSYNQSVNNSAFNSSLINQQGVPPEWFKDMPSYNTRTNSVLFNKYVLPYISNESNPYTPLQQPTTFNQPTQEEDNDFNNWYKKTILPTLNNLR